MAPPADPYPVISLSSEAALRIETIGSKKKFWLRHEGRAGLFKYTRQTTGEDWAEVIAEVVADKLGLPHAKHDFATHQGERGVISWSLLQPEIDSMVPGNEVLALIVEDYPLTSKDRWVSDHTVLRVLTLCDRVTAPPDWARPPVITCGGELFVGYLLLDALICNTDRHDQNWAWVFRRQEGKPGLVFMSPSFDHASSLGRELSDDQRHTRMTTKDGGYTIDAYLSRARSCISLSTTDLKAATPFEAFAEALKLRPAAARWWLKRLSELDVEEIRAAFRRVPEGRASEVAADFAISMITKMRARLLAIVTT